MRIAYIALKGMPLGGGIEHLTEQIGSRLVERGHEVIVYCSSQYNTKPEKYKGMDIKILPAINTKSLHKISLVFFSTLHLLMKEKVDIAHFHAVGPSVFSFLPRLKGIKTVVQIHGVEWKRPKWGIIGKTFLRLSDYSAVYFPNKVTAVSEVLKGYYEEKFGINVHYIPTGISEVNLREPNKILEYGLNKDSYIFFAARLVPDKGAHYLIDAFNNLKTDKKLVIAGDAKHEIDYINGLKQKANKNTLFLGFVTGELLEELFSNAYVYVLPSEIEGLSISLLEAMHYGDCVLVSNIPENLEAINGHGYTFTNKDSRDLQRMLELFLEKKELVDAKKDEAKRHVLTNYSWDKIVDMYEELYCSLLK
ncbi:MAG: glycosyltransferase family 4 protein [Nitrospirota bacterium]